MRTTLIGILIFSSTLVSAQIAFQYDEPIPVIVDGETLPMPWGGGLNSAQYNTIDLNQDGAEDLVIFDRTSEKVNTYLVIDGVYSYAPEYEYFFPEALRGWVILRDYDCDGKMDLFTRGNFGADLYRNVSGEFLEWELAFEPVVTKGTGSIINLNINASDIPAIEDVDGDGDLDILMFGFNGGSIQFHKNFSVERTGSCGEFDLERVTNNWGNFQECGCGSFAFDGEDCPPSGGRLQHIGGKSLLAYDMDGDTDMDVVIGEEDCTTLWFLENKGDKDNAVIDEAAIFPNAERPAAMRTFPAAYLLDIDFDDDKDLLVSPNTSGNFTFSASNFEASSWWYENQGTNSIPNFEFNQPDFLQDKMLDQGNNASVAFADEDGDGDLDMFTTSHGQVGSFGSYESRIYLYRNVGSKAIPVFELVDLDYLFLSFSATTQTEMRIQFTDMNADGAQDIVIAMTVQQSSAPSLYYIPNISTNRLNFSGQQPVFLTLPITRNDNPTFFDISGDGLVDVLLGKQNGRMEYYLNTGSAQASVFELETNEFYGIEQNFTHSNITPTIGDLNNDGKPEMITTDSKGEINIYEDFLSHLDEPHSGTNEVFFNQLTQSVSKSRLGIWARPTVADLYNSGTPVIAFGMAQGGVQILENVEALPPQAGNSDNLLTISPNPGTAFINEGKIEISTKEPISVRIVSILGKEVLPLQDITPEASLTISIEDLPSGVYITIAERNGKVVDQAKFVIAD